MDAPSVADRLETLPAELRQVLSLHFYADLTVRDVAAALDLPEGTVRTTPITVAKHEAPGGAGA